MAINLPNSPTDGQTVVLANKTLVWSSTTGTWNVQSSAGGGGSLSISDTAPSSPSDGDMWFNSTSLNLYAYYDDGNSQQWIELSSNDAQMGATVSDTAPSSPANGDFWFDSSTLTWYTYYDDGDSQQWLDLAGQATTVQVTASDTAPTSPSTGQLWFDTANLNLFVYYSDGSSNQWVQMNSEATAVPTDVSDLTDTGGLLGSGGVTAYANLAAFPSTGNTEGDFAFAQDTKALYIWDGTEWERVQHGNNSGPVFTTTPVSTLTIRGVDSNSTGTITAVATDESGFPVTYDWDAISGTTLYNSSSYPNQITNVSESNGVFTITPSLNDSDGGTFTFRTKASDGAQVSTATTIITVTHSQDITTSGATFNSDGTNSFDFSSALNNASGARFTSTLRTGKFYFEVVMGAQMTAAASKPLSVGFIDASVSDAGYNDTEWLGLQTFSGNYYPSGTSSPALGVCNVTGDIIMMAYDTSTREVWFGVNGTWERNPETDSGRIIGNTNTTAFKVMLTSSSGASQRYDGTFNVGPDNINYTLPSGFQAH